MKRNPKRVSKTVMLLTDPQPTYVSIVDHGANQTPFKVIKVAETPPETKKDDMKTNRQPVKKGAGEGEPQPVDIHKFVFPVAKFATEADVTKYLTQKGYSDFSIEKVGETFEVPGVDAASFESIETIEQDSGVLMLIGKRAEAPAEGQQAAEGTEGEGEGQPEPEATQKGEGSTEEPPVAPQLVSKSDKMLARKFDSYQAYYNSNGLTLSSVIADAADGLPIGYYDIHDCFVRALRNNLLAGNTSAISGLVKEFGAVILSLTNIVTTTQKDDGGGEDAISTLFPESAPAPEKVAKSEGGEEEPPKAPESEAGEGTPPENPEGEQAPAAGEEKPEGTPQEPVKKEEGTPSTTDALLEKILKGQESLTTGLASLNEKVSKGDERLSKLESIRQTRKSADTDEAGGVQSEEGEPSPGMSRVQKNAFGMI